MTEYALTDRRNYGIDLLRIVSMLMIPILHILGHGGILNGSQVLSAHNETAWFFVAVFLQFKIWQRDE